LGGLTNMLSVCLASFYLSFLLVIGMKDLLIFAGLKYSDGNVTDILKLMLVFDLIILFSLPLMIMLTGGSC